ncbi:PAS domain S-box protein [Mucilaginibacter daejeonensis]|uniref:GAF domain-containing protein n=1 Tax=Mucilaginibacter daejeonensis TaxID=398049 RepID=UPI001D171E3D|nr:GAF domain-containing protein [Mucilaginibacter daejeonensis]UEG53100.1 PAS domain S-box protein [Mucilaginibacter daejeonensis]
MPLRELERIRAVNRLLKLEISKEKELQEIVELAATICGTSIALITLLDADTQTVLFQTGLAGASTMPRTDSFCDKMITNEHYMEVQDAMLDHRFIDNPFVTGTPNIRFYAGSSLTTQDGLSLGALCVLDSAPQKLSHLQEQMLKALSKQVIQLLEFDMSIQILRTQYVKAREAEIELRAFFESTIDHHLLLGKEFEVLAFNRAWESHVAYSYNKTLTRGRSMKEYMHPENIGQFYRDYNKALKGTAVYDERNLGINGTESWHMVKFEPAFDLDGQIIGVSVNTANVDRRVKQEGIVRSQNRSLEQIAYMQAHELRKPVANIMGLIGVMKETGQLTPSEELTHLDASLAELDQQIKSIVDKASSRP